MRVAVVGLGGVGGYLAANFAKAGIDVVGFARGEHKEAIQKNGLMVEEDDKSYKVSLKLNDCSKPFDVVVFCVKSYDLYESIKEMQGCITNKTVVISLANGVANAQLLQEHTDGIVVEGIVYILSFIKAPGVIRKKGKVFSVVFGTNEILASLFEQAKLRFKQSDDIQKELWKKYIFIAAFALLTSYYNKSIYQVVSTHYEEARHILKEIAFIAKRKGIDIDKEVEKSLKVAQTLPKDATTSMHKDFKNNAKTELDSLGGYLVQSAKELGTAVPMIEKVYKELKNRYESL